MAEYTNDLRLKEIATGDESGTWGTSTNTNLELIGEGLSFTTKDCFASNADQTETVADGSTDPLRGMYVKVTSSATLSATRVLTILPNTVSRLQFIENGTTTETISVTMGAAGTNKTFTFTPATTAFSAGDRLSLNWDKITNTADLYNLMVVFRLSN